MQLTSDERASIVAQAIDRKFGKLLTWERPDLAHTFGANNLDHVESFEKELSETRKIVRTALDQTSDEDLGHFQSTISDNMRIDENHVDGISAKQINRLHRIIPPPISYGFGHPTFAAKFDYWASMPSLTLHETALLSLGADPSCMKDDKFAEMQKSVDRGEFLWAAYTSFLNQREIFRRCFHFTGFGYASEEVASIKRWVDDLDINVHSKFYEGLEARTTPKVIEVGAENAPRPTQTSKVMTDQEIVTLLKLVAAMAVNGYAFVPDAKRNQATADIQSDLDQLGVSLDQKTILKWIRTACDVLPKGLR